MIALLPAPIAGRKAAADHRVERDEVLARIASFVGNLDDMLDPHADATSGPGPFDDGQETTR